MKQVELYVAVSVQGLVFGTFSSIEEADTWADAHRSQHGGSWDIRTVYPATLPAKSPRSRHVLIETGPYYSSHLKQPRGRGSWAFALGSRHAEPWFAPGSMTYAEARKLAKARAIELGVVAVYVLP